MDGEIRSALEDALHALVTTNGLTASDGLSAYGRALSEGCDPNGAWDVFEAETFKIDNGPVIRSLVAVLDDPQKASKDKQEEKE